MIQTTAPALDLAAPRLEMLADALTGDVRTVRLRAVSDRGASHINVELALPGEMTDCSNGLPEIPGLTIALRPPEFMPAPYDFNDPTVVRTAIVVGQ